MHKIRLLDALQGQKSKKESMTYESKPNHQYATNCSVNRVFEKEMEVFRSQECHNHLQIDVFYLWHLSDLKKVNYASSYGHFI